MRVAELAAHVKGLPLADAMVAIGFEADCKHTIAAYQLVASLTPSQLLELADLVRLEPFDQEQVDMYEREAAEHAERVERERKAAARFMLDDPHLSAQREGWGL